MALAAGVLVRRKSCCDGSASAAAASACYTKFGHSAVNHSSHRSPHDGIPTSTTPTTRRAKPSRGRPQCNINHDQPCKRVGEGSEPNVDVCAHDTKSRVQQGSSGPTSLLHGEVTFHPPQGSATLSRVGTQRVGEQPRGPKTGVRPVGRLIALLCCVDVFLSQRALGFDRIMCWGDDVMACSHHLGMCHEKAKICV